MTKAGVTLFLDQSAQAVGAFDEGITHIHRE
jgi:hypothetical protein